MGDEAPGDQDAGVTESGVMLVVPRVPTKEMIDAAWAETEPEGVYRAMIDAWVQSSKGKSVSDSF